MVRFRAPLHRVGLACLTNVARLLSPLVSAMLMASLKSSSRNMATAFGNSGLSVALARPQTRQKLLLAPSTPYCVIASIKSLSCLTINQGALLLCPINHHLVDWRFPQYLRHRAGALAPARRKQYLASSACSVIALAQLSPLLRSFSASLRAARSCALRASGEPRRLGLGVVRSSSLALRTLGSYLLTKAVSAIALLAAVAANHSLSISASLSNTMRPFQPVFLGAQFRSFASVFP